jgi:TolB-like protein
MSFFEELKRRKVFRVAATYAVVAWILMQIGEVTFPALNIPEWVMSTLVVVLLAGFPIAVIFAWIFDKTPQGFIKTDVSDTENIGGMNVKVDNRPFYLQKRNIILVLGILIGVLIGTYSGDSFKGSIDNKSIAVLPFDNYSTAAEDQYFSDGMTEVIIANLAKVKDLKVISRTSVMEYKNTTKKLKEIAKELGVAHILEGSIQRANGRVRVVGQLIDANTDEHIWAETYDKKESDIFELQSDVAIEIANALKTELTDEVKARISEKLTESTIAYEYYLKGNMYESAGHSKENLFAAISEYERAVAIDPDFAEAHAQIGKMHAHVKWYRYDLSDTRLEISKQSIDRSMNLKPNNAIVRIARGTYYYHGFRDYGKALADYIKARELAPGNISAIYRIGLIYRRLGDYDKAIEQMEQAIGLDPRSALMLMNLSGSYLAKRNYEKVFPLVKRTVDLGSMRGKVTYGIPTEFFITGNVNNAIEELKNIDINAYRLKIYYYRLLNNYNEIEHILSKSTEEFFGNVQYYYPREYYFGLAALGLGRKDDAKKFFNSTVLHLNNKIKNYPEDPRFYSTLGLTYALLGEKNKALDSGIKATEVLPISKDAMFGANHEKTLTIIYSIIGEKNKALEKVEYLSVVPNGFHYGELFSDPYFDSIRDEPRFQTVLNNLKPKS